MYPLKNHIPHSTIVVKRHSKINAGNITLSHTQFLRQWLRIIVRTLVLVPALGGMSGIGGIGVKGALQRAQAQGVMDNPAYVMLRVPIPIRDARPYNLLFLQFVPESGDVLASRKNCFDLQLDLINNLLIPEPGLGASVVEDNEYQRLRFAWRRGLVSSCRQAIQPSCWAVAA